VVRKDQKGGTRNGPGAIVAPGTIGVYLRIFNRKEDRLRGQLNENKSKKFFRRKYHFFFYFFDFCDFAVNIFL
jgi:hypothetical protein